MQIQGADIFGNEQEKARKVSVVDAMMWLCSCDTLHERFLPRPWQEWLQYHMQVGEWEQAWELVVTVEEQNVCIFHL